jgi:hypothetical protein
MAWQRRKSIVAVLVSVRSEIDLVAGDERRLEDVVHVVGARRMVRPASVTAWSRCSRENAAQVRASHGRRTAFAGSEQETRSRGQHGSGDL